MNCFKLLLISSFILITVSISTAQISRKVLFLGNSYTYVNDLPQMVHDVALSAGDTLIFDSYAPGGYQLKDHVADATSQSKIMTAGWNYVVLQGQSQEPIIDNSDFSSGGYQLNSLATQSNSCSVTMLYMTWGRKNGDATNCPAFPEMCTYEGMDSTLKKRYLNLASTIHAEVSPVSVVWKYLRQNHPGIELYQPDESHPSVEGTYAAACCFYTLLFKKDPTLVSFNSALSASDAAIIRDAVKSEVYNNLNLYDFKQPPVSYFRYEIGTGVNEVSFNPVYNFGTAETFLWDFGDGDTSSSPNVVHSYLSNGTYTVSLTTTNCDLQGLHTSFTDTVIEFCNHTPTISSTNPWLCNHDTLWTQPADSYQWFVNGIVVPQSSQYLPDYAQYNFGNVNVLSTVNGCSEMSAGYSDMPAWSGYYFDYLPLADPCIGDTVVVAVAHAGGSLTGFEIIHWYKNDTLLTFMNNEDTLFIHSGGIYECYVIDPNSNCPLDTTSFFIEIDCGISGIEETVPDLPWRLFPNPASEIITIKFSQNVQEQVEIYSITGYLLKVVHSSGTTEINITDLPNGLYFIKLKDSSLPSLKFIKE